MRLKELRKMRGITQKELAELLHISDSTLSNWEQGRFEPDNETLIWLASFFGVSIEDLLGNQDPRVPHNNVMKVNQIVRVAGIMDSEQIDKTIDFATRTLLDGHGENGESPLASTGGVWIPVLGDVAAGVPIEAVEEVLDYEEIAASVAACGEHFALRIKGESMAPRMATGDVVIVRCQSDVENGEVAVVVVNGDSATVKKIKKSPDGMALVPTNPACEVMIYTNEQIAELPVTIIGKVVELRAKF